MPILWEESNTQEIIKSIIEWAIENKALVALLCISIGVTISIKINIGGNKVKGKREGRIEGRYTRRKSDRYQTTDGLQNQRSVDLVNIRLYSTGLKGKVYTNVFYKMINHNFGIEITLKNYSSVSKKVKIGWCVYKGDEEVVKGTFYKKVNANSSLTSDFYVKKNFFDNLNCGKYTSVFWLNNQRVQKTYFTIQNK